MHWFTLLSKRFSDLPFPSSEVWHSTHTTFVNVFPVSLTFEPTHCLESCHPKTTNLTVIFQDWEAATGMVYPRSFFHTVKGGEVEIQPPRDLFTEENFVKFKRDWEDKVISAC